MAIPYFEVPIGAINGVNTLFTTSVAYKAGSTAVFVNGMLRVGSDDDGWSETDPNAGEVTLVTAPLTGDKVQIFFLDTTPDVADSYEELSGYLEDTSSLSGSLEISGAISGTLTTTSAYTGTLTISSDLSGTIYDEDVLSGTVDACTY